MKNKGKGRTDLKYIAVLFVLIMMFSAIGILFGNVQIGNNSNNTKFMPASNPAGSLNLIVPIGNVGNLSYFFYSNGTILIALSPSNSISNDYAGFFYGNDSFNGFTYDILVNEWSIAPAPTIGSILGLWITNDSTIIHYNASVSNGVDFIPSDMTSGGYFSNQFSNSISQNLNFSIARATSSTSTYTHIPPFYNFKANLFYEQNEVGQTSVLTAITSGGVNPVSYQWYVNGLAISGATSSSYSYSASIVSQANIICQIVDGAGDTVWSEPTFIMTNAHTSVSLSGHQYVGGVNEADVGQSILFTGTFSYNPYGISKNGIFTGTNQFASGTTTAVSGSYTFDASGSYTIEFYAVDTNGYNATTTISYTIYADPILSALSTKNSIGIYNNIKTTDVNIPITIIGNASLGYGSYTYSWSATGGVITGSGNSIIFTSSIVSSGYTITVVLKDSNDYPYTTTINIIVNSALSVVITTTTTGQ